MIVGERLHLHVGVGIEAEVPEAALVVGQRRIDRGVVEVEHFLAGIALVVFGDEIVISVAAPEDRYPG